MRSIEELQLVPVWVNTGHLVSTAKHIMGGHNLRVLAVVDGGIYVGSVTRERLAASQDDQRVGEIMDPPSVVLSPGTPVRRAAELFAEENLDYAAVADQKVFLGMLTPQMLLRELGRSWDPLTNLSWSDALREWGIENLRDGREVAVIFIDLDDFGQFNKNYGHIVGDRVLRKVARGLEEFLDPSDILVRYGGDEFAIGSLRSADAAQEYAQQLLESVSGKELDHVAEPVTFSVGVAGGKRTKEREKVHYAATMDSLINLASKDCMAKKASRTPAKAATAATAGRLPACVLLVSADDQNPATPTAVTLSLGGEIITEVQVRGDRPVIESVAMATARAIERKLGATLILDDIQLVEGNGHGKFITVKGRVRTASGDVPIAGTCSAEKDIYAAAAQAVLEAVTVWRGNF